MQPMSGEQRAALSDPTTRAAVFVEIDHPTGRLYLWSGSGIIDARGVEWLGAGFIASISGIESGMDPRISRVIFAVAGVPGDTLDMTVSDLKNRQAHVYHGLMRPDGKLIGDLLLKDTVDLDKQETAMQDDGRFMVGVTGQSGYWQLEKAPRGIWSPEEQQALYPGDTGMDGLPVLEDLLITWTRT